MADKLAWQLLLSSHNAIDCAWHCSLEDGSSDNMGNNARIGRCIEKLKRRVVFRLGYLQPGVVGQITRNERDDGTIRVCAGTQAIPARTGPLSTSGTMRHRTPFRNQTQKAEAACAALLVAAAPAPAAEASGGHARTPVRGSVPLTCPTPLWHRPGRRNPKVAWSASTAAGRPTSDCCTSKWSHAAEECGGWEEEKGRTCVR